MKRLIESTYYYFPLALFCLYYCIKALYYPIHDFANYFFGGHFFLEGKFNSALYFPSFFNTEIARLGYEHIFVSYAPNTPFLALVFAPLSILKLPLAKFLFNMASSILLVISLHKLTKYYQVNKRLLLLLPLLFFLPFKNNLLFGQVYFLVFYLLTEFWLAYSQNKLTKSALFLSIAIMLKVSPAIFIFIFLFKKQFKPVLICGLSCLILMLLTSIFSGFTIWEFWFKEVFNRASNGEIAGVFVDNYQSVFMFLKRLLVFDLYENPKVLYNAPEVFKAINLGLKIAFLSIGFYFTNKKNNPLSILSFWVLASLFLSPYGSTYSLVTLVFVACFIIGATFSNGTKMTFLSVLFLINNLPTSYFLSLDFPFSYIRLLLFLMFAILFLSATQYKIHHNKIIIIAPLIAIISMFFINVDSQNTRSVLQKDSPILIYDFDLKDNYLQYTFWNEFGEIRQRIPFQFQTKEQLELKDNQIYLGEQQLTFSESNKLKPILIDNKKVVFLSDANRGIGFYTLKEMDLK